MSDDSKKVDAGEVLDVTLARPKRERAPGPTSPRRGIVPVDDETPRRIPSGSATFQFFDLGTRLQSSPASADFTDARRVRARDASDDAHPAPGAVSEYLEIENEITPETTFDFDKWLVPAPANTTILRASSIADYDAGILGRAGDPLSPFGKTRANGSAREVANCAPLPFNLDPTVVEVHAGGTFYQVGTADPSDPPKYWRKSKDRALAGERWSPAAAATGEGGKEAGELRTRAGGRLVVFAPNCFDSFDTGDRENFKVTAEPSFDAPEVRFSITPAAHRVYLRPRLWAVEYIFDSLVLWTNPTTTPPTNGFDSFPFFRYEPFIVAARRPLQFNPPFSITHAIGPAPLDARERAALLALALRSPKARDEYLRLKARFNDHVAAEYAHIGWTGHAADPPAQTGARASVLDYRETPAEAAGALFQTNLFECERMLVGVIARGSRLFYVWLKTTPIRAWGSSPLGFPYGDAAFTSFGAPVPPFEVS